MPAAFRRSAALLIATAAATGDGNGTNGTNGCACAQIFRPVCGADNVTYGNGCEASCTVSEIACNGECPCPTNGTNATGEDCGFCAKINQPVCGADNVTYSNHCEAGCATSEIACLGACPCPTWQGCACAEIYQPVCGKDGVMYSNTCEANCLRGDYIPGVECHGECPCYATTRSPNCFCADIYQPVCGVDNKTYPNECDAGCTVSEIKCEGECPCEDSISRAADGWAGSTAVACLLVLSMQM